MSQYLASRFSAANGIDFDLCPRVLLKVVNGNKGLIWGNFVYCSQVGMDWQQWGYVILLFKFGNTVIGERMQN